MGQTPSTYYDADSRPVAPRQSHSELGVGHHPFTYRVNPMVYEPMAARAGTTVAMKHNGSRDPRGDLDHLAGVPSTEVSGKNPRAYARVEAVNKFSHPSKQILPSGAV
jgi:hypothetical protein